MLMTNIYILLFLLCTPAIAADLNSACGSYEVSGLIRKGAKHYSIAIAEGTKSEKHLVLPFGEELKALPYVNMPVKAQVTLSKRVHGVDDFIDSLDSIQSRVPDPLHPAQDSYYKQVKPAPCKEN